jgi:hypothetical protein
MREVHCLYCNATNRRPKCGKCQKEIADPAAIWKLYEQRRYLRYAGYRVSNHCSCNRFVTPMADLLLLLSNQCCRMQRASRPHRQIERRYARAY